MFKQKIAAYLQTLIFLCNATGITASEAEEEDKRAHSNAVIIHTDHNSFSSTQPRIPNATDTNDDEDNKSTSSPKSEQASVLLIHNGQDEDWFSEVRQLQTIAADIYQLRDKEIKAHENLYKKMLSAALPHFPQGIPPQRFQSVRLVTDPSSYHIYTMTHHGSLQIHNRLPSLSRGNREPYAIYVPVFNPLQAGDLKFDAAPTSDDAFGQLIQHLGHFTSFAHARREEMARILRRIKGSVLLASFIGTTAYWMWLDKQLNTSQRRMTGDFFINFWSHIGTLFVLDYPIRILHNCKRRSDTLQVDQTIIQHIPYIADVDPSVNYLARRYAVNKLKEGLDKLYMQRNVRTWLCCCPLFFKIAQLLKAPLKNVPATERINQLLDGSYNKLHAKLLKEGMSDIDGEAARRVCTKYDDILASMYTLNQNNLEDIVHKTFPSLTLSYRGRNTLLGIMARSREQLTNCMPAHIRNKAQAQQPTEA